jgi:hypothetical protein
VEAASVAANVSSAAALLLAIDAFLDRTVSSVNPNTPKISLAELAAADGLLRIIAVLPLLLASVDFWGSERAVVAVEWLFCLYCPGSPELAWAADGRLGRGIDCCCCWRPLRVVENNSAAGCIV